VNKLLFASLLLCACGSSNETDDLASLEPDTAVKADSTQPHGAYEITASKLRADDIVYVNLLPRNTATPQINPNWVWNRCYDTPCSLLVPQDGNYEFYKSAKTGKKYIEFYTVHIDPPSTGTGSGSPKTMPPVKNPNPTYDPGDLIDLYEYKLSAKTLKLRRANTSRWFTLAAFSDQAACSESGGTFGSNGNCDCTALGTGAFNQPAYFQPGMGGCFLIPNSSEDACDSTNGAYTDDDNNLVGSYCDCGVGRYFADSVGCTDVP
jgi:hypothetical protein